MKLLKDGFPEKNKLIIVYLKDGTDFIGSLHSGGSGVTSIDGEFTEHYYCDDESEEKYHFDNIVGWDYCNISGRAIDFPVYA